jgi:ketosteroid isomerase-like protein
MSRPTKEVTKPVKEYFASFERGDFETVWAQFAEEALITVPGTGKLAGEYRGASGFTDFLGILGAHVDAERSAFAVDDLASGERYVIVREVARLARQDAPDRVWELPLLLRFTVAGDRIAELNIVPEDAQAYDAFWATAPPDER